MSFPMVKYYMDQLGIYDLFAKYVEKSDAFLPLILHKFFLLWWPILCAHHGLCNKIEQWAAGYMDGLSEYGFQLFNLQ